MSQSPYEPTADMRIMARQLKDMYRALIAEGFTTREALSIIGSVIAAGVQQDQQDE